MRLTIRKSDNLEDWYVIERAEHDGRMWVRQDAPNVSSLMSSARFSDADVEGTAAEMVALADAIEKRALGLDARRCAVDARKDRVEFWSPRNSSTSGYCTIEEATALAREIRDLLANGNPGSEER